jgi:hypothetical protein
MDEKVISCKLIKEVMQSGFTYKNEEDQRKDIGSQEEIIGLSGIMKGARRIDRKAEVPSERKQ